MLKCACIFYHKNISTLYQRAWIDECIDSIVAQTHKDFDIFELNYGGDDQRYTNGRFLSIPLDNHIGAMNLLLDMIFGLGYDVVFNTNMDDIYDPQRFEKQLIKIKEGYHVVSSDFEYFGEQSKLMKMSSKGDIGRNLLSGHNVIAHPVVAIHRNFWTPGIRYKNLLGYEDLDLWQRAIRVRKKFFIIPEVLLRYRIHGSQVTKTHKGKNK